MAQGEQAARRDERDASARNVSGAVDLGLGRVPEGQQAVRPDQAGTPPHTGGEQAARPDRTGASPQNVSGAVGEWAAGRDQADPSSHVLSSAADLDMGRDHDLDRVADGERAVRRDGDGALPRNLGGIRDLRGARHLDLSRGRGSGGEQQADRPDPKPAPGRKRGRRHAGVSGDKQVRPAPATDLQLTERPGAVLPGWAGLLAGCAAIVVCAVVVWWAGAVPEPVMEALGLPFHPYSGLAIGPSLLLALGMLLGVFAFGGVMRGRVGFAWVLSLFGDYRGTVRRTGLVWVSPLLMRRRIDVRLRHWRSEPLPVVDANGTALRAVVLVVWRIKDTAQAALAVADHERYLREQVEAALARVLSQLPADAFQEDGPTLRNAEAVGEALTGMVSAECAPVGIEVFSAQPVLIEYAPEIAAAMQRRRVAAIDAKHRDAVLGTVVDAVDDMVHRLTTRGLVELDDYDRKALVKDLTVAFYTGRNGPAEGA
ncbi:SPFH domain-containing protein [Streptomyces coeruleoprunus]|uniref:SPFH domain-containing protein n=1 Tax=Streptomyces coeruleoprunus TaxID=285563 RepID=A0ABV9XRE3_9ACTN